MIWLFIARAILSLMAPTEAECVTDSECEGVI
jgi:hypothetical protein